MQAASSMYANLFAARRGAGGDGVARSPGRVHAALALIGEALVVMLFLTLSPAAFAQDD